MPLQVTFASAWGDVTVRHPEIRRRLEQEAEIEGGHRHKTRAADKARESDSPTMRRRRSGDGGPACPRLFPVLGSPPNFSSLRHHGAPPAGRWAGCWVATCRVCPGFETAPHALPDTNRERLCRAMRSSVLADGSGRHLRQRVPMRIPAQRLLQHAKPTARHRRLSDDQQSGPPLDGKERAFHA